MCRIRRSFRTKFTELLDKLPIADFQKETIKSRFVDEVCSLEDDYNRSAVLFIGLTNLVTIAGILITAFTTLTKAISVDPYWQTVISWSVFAMSLSLTLANGWLTTFGIYKKYVLNDVTLEKMYNEGWSFIAGVNRYEKLSQEERFIVFCSKIEQIITRTTIKQLADNTAGVNVHDVMEVPNEEKVSSDKVSSDKVSSDKVNSDKVSSDKVNSDKVNSDKVNSDNTDNTDNTNETGNITVDEKSRDVAIEIPERLYQQDNIVADIPYKTKRKKKNTNITKNH